MIPRDNYDYANDTPAMKKRKMSRGNSLSNSNSNSNSNAIANSQSKLQSLRDILDKKLHCKRGLKREGL